MKLPAGSWQESADIRLLLDRLGAREGDTRFVGGCVRDTLLGLKVSDVDLATRITPDQVMIRLDDAGIKCVPTGLAHGTVTAVLKGRPVEITTLRRDVSTDGRRASIAYTDDWREDAARRDFTINALSADPVSRDIHDYFGGMEDLQARHVRFIGDPLTRISEDHLRILRFFRFHARFGAGEPDPEGLRACAERANDLMALSRERIADELLKLLGLPDPSHTVRLMIEKGFFRPVLPEVANGERLTRLISRERDARIGPDPLRRLSALLPSDPEIARDIAARLRLSKKAAKRIVSAAGTELESPEILAYRIGAVEAIDRILLHGDPAAADVKRLAGWTKPHLPIGGGDLIAMGLPPGPIVAATLQAIDTEWAESGFPKDKEVLSALARRHVERALRTGE